MARESECEHDIGFYRVVGGDGLDVTEACGECGCQITSESPKTAYKREEQEKQEKKSKRAEVKKREAKKEEAEVIVKKNLEKKSWDKYFQ